MIWKHSCVLFKEFKVISLLEDSKKQISDAWFYIFREAKALVSLQTDLRIF